MTTDLSPLWADLAALVARTSVRATEPVVETGQEERVRPEMQPQQTRSRPRVVVPKGTLIARVTK